MNTSNIPFNKFHFVSSNGDVYTDLEGNVLPESDLSDYLVNISKVDIEEYLNYHSIAGFDINKDISKGVFCGDILEVNYWDKSNNYVNDTFTHRVDVWHVEETTPKTILRNVIKAHNWAVTNRACTGLIDKCNIE